MTTVPRPDHVVVLILENHSSGEVLGNPAAPYINSLAASGANMTSSFALTHPSQPNYVALFSGSVNGVTDDSCPNTLSADNLGAQLTNSGQGFAGYAEDLPSVGYTGCTSGSYARKHSPWVNFTNVPASANRPLTQFPADYSTLPAVSIVIPNLQHDMHDGSIAQGDAWVQAQLDGYVQWAKQHNSVFLLTFDEDDNTANNQIPTIFQGQNVQPGQYSEHIDHYNILRTLQDAYGLAPIGNSATASPILDIWKPDLNAPQASFTTTCVGLTCSADGSGSTAATGSLTGWRWTWGDGSVTTEPTRASHTYAASGDFTVTLQVTDDQGRTGQTTRSVSPRTPGPVVFASDAFNRTVTAGLGSADVGGAWALVGSASTFSVTPGAASLVQSKAGAGLTAYLPSAKSTDTDVQMAVATNPLPNSNGLYLTMLGRRVGTNMEYEGKARVRGDGSVVISLSMLTGTATAVTLKSEVVAAGVSLSAGMPLNTRLQVTGTSPTTLRWKVWSGASEPATWQLTATDSTAVLQAAGAVGITTYLSSSSTIAPVTAKLSAFSARGTAPPVNQPPTAAFTATAANLVATFDATASSDPDGTVTGYAWDFGDTGSGTGSRPTHTYGSAGSYPVKLTVTDDQGATNSVTKTVTVTAPPVNQPPTAAFTATAANLVATFDATASSDPDGTVTGYAWDFGDTGSGTGSRPTHTYGSAGSYPVKLTVTDDQGATNSVTKTVTVTAPPEAPIAADDFGRTVAIGWGSADVGGAWTTSSGSNFAVSNGTGSLTMKTAGSGPAIYLNSASASDADLQFTFAPDKAATGGGYYLTAVGRRVANIGEYRAKVHVLAGGSVRVALTFSSSTNVESTMVAEAVVPNLTVSPGDVVQVRFQASGTSSTTLRAKVWKVGSAEPGTWIVSTVDARAGMQTSGGVGLWTYLSSTATNAPLVLRIDNLRLVRPSTTP
ncbi:PKD domain-containing protein [Terrabacter sp. Ter38]|uniref:PKD domain-containing protein n=1 Tax=Terrabacter sp. Ter38 TaxID=2926030 RepID=UPI00211947B4|nr:PKD domain-containing protein [Terrabacter sp. Ter38]